MNDRYRFVIAAAVVLGILCVPVMIYFSSDWAYLIGVGLGWTAREVVRLREEREGEA